jgi:glycine/D-amino acid oxidase-like deaminating enzyme
MPDPVIVIGGSLAGLAAAARLAKAGHAIELYEKSDELGGTWAPYQLQSGVTVDNAPAIIGFPAPWRDLFRKSGRPLEAELGRMGYALEPAGPPTMIFADGSELALPTDRGGQYANVAGGYGRLVAERWLQLLDRLDEVWQTLRGLGLEAELRSGRQLNRTIRRSLFGRRLTVADLAASIDHEHLGALIRSVAYRSGSVPEQTPAFAAVELSIMRTFGRWQVQPLDPDTGFDVGRSSILVEALAARLALRKVEVHLGCSIESINIRNGRVAGVSTGAGPPGSGGRRYLRSMAGLQRAASGHRDTSHSASAAQPEPGSSSDHYASGSRAAYRARYGDSPPHRCRHTDSELPPPTSRRGGADSSRLREAARPSFVRCGVEWLPELAVPTAGDDRNSRPVCRQPILAGRPQPIARRALRRPGGLQLSRLPGRPDLITATLGTQPTSVYLDVCSSE